MLAVATSNNDSFVSAIGQKWINIHTEQLDPVSDSICFLFACDGDAFVILDCKEKAEKLFQALEKRYRNLTRLGGYKPDIQISIKPERGQHWRVDFNLNV
ncbi:TPA: hypothetical protein I6W77_003231 [Vibrio cholerae]|nr:hypothetical protein [Vibrio cholerae]